MLYTFCHVLRNSVYSEINKECLTDLIKLDEKYRNLEEKSPNKTLSTKHKEQYLKESKMIQTAYYECENKNQPQKIESLRTLLKKIEDEDKAVSTINALSSDSAPFSAESIRTEFSNLMSGTDLVSKLEVSLRIKVSFDLDIDGVIKNIKVENTDNEEVKLVSALTLYSIPKVFQPIKENNQPVKSKLTFPVSFIIE